MSRMAKYTTIVGPSNLNSDNGKPVTVYATSSQDAVNRAVEIGWSGRARDASVWIRKVEDVPPPVLCDRHGDPQ